MLLRLLLTAKLVATRLPIPLQPTLLTAAAGESEEEVQGELLCNNNNDLRISIKKNSSPWVKEILTT